MLISYLMVWDSFLCTYSFCPGEKLITNPCHQPKFCKRAKSEASQAPNATVASAASLESSSCWTRSKMNAGRPDGQQQHYDYSRIPLNKALFPRGGGGCIRGDVPLIFPWWLVWLNYRRQQRDPFNCFHPHIVDEVHVTDKIQHCYVWSRRCNSRTRNL